eukprot:TRINITY_DN7233_c0_g1_i1.p1 TRINITY_DN7233_c0_g1~~TRINITY_DN7233_c0_g1_i1.p1  ORF type:complete len:187 (+),score=48.72 TRINITY_DN7233_c0_g1_i1:61-621(+)
MACGFGVAAVRALSMKMPTPPFRGSFSLPRGMQSGRSLSKYGLMKDEDAEESATFMLRSTTVDAADERLLEGDVYSDHMEQDSEDEDDASEAGSEQPVREAERTRTLLSDKEFPDLSSFLDPEWIKNYNKLYLSDGEDSDADESDAEEMYSGPLEPRRTKAHRDFPHPSTYLTKGELVEMWCSLAQ